MTARPNFNSRTCLALLCTATISSVVFAQTSSLDKTEAAIGKTLNFNFREKSCQLKSKQDLNRAFDYFYSLQLLNGYYRQCSKPLERDLGSLSLNKFNFLVMLRRSEEPIKACIRDNANDQTVFVNSSAQISKIAPSSGCDEVGYRAALNLLSKAMRAEPQTASVNNTRPKPQVLASNGANETGIVTAFRYTEPSIQGGMTLKELTDGRVAVDINTVNDSGNACNFTGIGKLKDSSIKAKSADSDVVIDIQIGKTSAKIIDRPDHAEFCGANAYFSGNYALQSAASNNQLSQKPSTQTDNSIINQSIADLIAECKPVDESLFKFAAGSPKNPLKGENYRFRGLPVEGYVGADSDVVSIYGWQFKASEEIVRDQLQLKPIKARVKFDQTQKQPYIAVLKWRFDRPTGTTDVFCEVKY